MKVFGIGLNKTGTTTLGKALEILGFTNHVSFDLLLTQNWHDNNLQPILKTAKANNNFEDWPWPLVYKEMYYEFSDAKFILTKRTSANMWYESLCKHALRTGPTEFRKLIYSHDMPQNYKDEHINYYQKHNNEVTTFFKEKAPHKLLTVCWENNEGWKEICEFLEVAIPKVDFPNLNRASDFEK